MSGTVPGSGISGSGRLLPQSPQLPTAPGGLCPLLAAGPRDNPGKGREPPGCKTSSAHCEEVLLALSNQTKRSRGSPDHSPMLSCESSASSGREECLRRAERSLGQARPVHLVWLPLTPASIRHFKGLIPHCGASQITSLQGSFLPSFHLLVSLLNICVIAARSYCLASAKENLLSLHTTFPDFHKDTSGSAGAKVLPVPTAGQGQGQEQGPDPGMTPRPQHPLGSRGQGALQTSLLLRGGH